MVRDLERRLRAAQRDWRSPAVSAGVVRDGTLVWSGHVGAARVDGAVPPGDDTQYMIGSITKTFTAVLVMALRDEGRLALDDRLDTYLPGTRHGAVTIRQMLAHASGLQREPVGRIWENLEAPDQERLLRELEDAERVLPPHFVFHYSNLAYALLGQIVERLEKRSWEETVTERILNPLEMRHTGLTPDEDARALGYLVHPHAGTVTVEPRFDLRATSALGGLWSTVADLGRYASFVADPVAEVLSPDSVEEMCRPLIMTDVDGWGRAYGLGFDLQRAGERVLAGHGGAMPGYLAGLRVRRADRVGAVVFSNSSAGAETVALATELVTAVLDAEPALARGVAALAAPGRPGRDARQLVVRGRGDRLRGARRPAVGPAPRRRRPRRDPVRARGRRPLPGRPGSRARRAARGRARRRRGGAPDVLRDLRRHPDAAGLRRAGGRGRRGRPQLTTGTTRWARGP